MIYFIIIFIMCGVIFFDYIRYEQKRTIMPLVILCVYFILAIFAGVRYEIGLDYYGYMDIYNDTPKLEKIIMGEKSYTDIHGELGYLLLNSIVKSTFDEFYFVILLMGFFSVGVFVYSSYLYSCSPLISIFLYVNRFFFMRDMGQIRSALACALILYSIEAIEKRMIWKFLLIIGAALSFHTAALIAIPVYFLGKYRLSNYIYVFAIFVSCFLGALVPFKELLFAFFGVDNSIMTNYVFSEYGESLTIFNPVNIMQVCILLLFIINRRKLEGKIFGYNTMLNMYTLSTCWLVAFNQLGVISGRIATMLATVEVFIIPSFLFVSNNKFIRIISLILILVCSLIFMYLNFEKNETYHLFMPYKSIL